MAKVNTSLCEARMVKTTGFAFRKTGFKFQFDHLLCDFREVTQIHSFLFHIDKTEKIICQDFSETHKITGNQLSSTNTTLCQTMPLC